MSSVEVGTAIGLAKAELLSILIEGVLYGFSLLMFGGTIWALVTQRSTRRVNYTILTVACLLMLVSTTHFVVDIIRLMQGLVMYQGYQEGSIVYFANVSEWTSVYRNYLFTVQTLLGDSVVLYRCYVVWQSKLVMVLPVLLWCSVGVTGFAGAYAAAHLIESGPFGSHLSPLVTAFWGSALATNLLSTLLLAYRIWCVDKNLKRVYGPGESHLRPILFIIIDAGVIYSVALLAALISYLCQSDLQYAMITPIVSITFYMVIIRVGLANRAKQPVNVPLEHPGFSHGTDRELGMQVHIMTLTESKVDQAHGRLRSSTPTDMHESEQSEDACKETYRSVGESV